jgi:hypothetical protein
MHSFFSSSALKTQSHYNANMAIIYSEVVGLAPDQGYLIFLGTTYQNGGKYAK